MNLHGVDIIDKSTCKINMDLQNISVTNLWRTRIETYDGQNDCIHSFLNTK